MGNSFYTLESQGLDKRVLFVCSVGMLRSATAARLYAPKYNTRACGTDKVALIPLTWNLLNWAQEIVFMHQKNEEAALKEFPIYELSHKPKIVVLDIRDEYKHMDLELLQELEEQYEPVAKFKR